MSGAEATEPKVEETKPAEETKPTETTVCDPIAIGKNMATRWPAT